MENFEEDEELLCRKDEHIFLSMSKEKIINEAFALHSNGQIKEAAKYYQAFIDRGYLDARVLCNYGVICKQIGLAEKALKLYKKSIELDPNNADSYTNIGNILRDQGKLKEAELFQRKATELNPYSSEAHSNLATLLKDIGRLKEAELSTRKAIELNPNYGEAHSNLGSILKALGQPVTAETHSRKAVELQPENPLFHLNLAIILLTAKKFDEGWEEYEWRWKIKNKHIGKKLNTSKPEWKPDKRGKVLLWAEQGLGDEILFSTLIPDLIDKVDRLIIKSDSRLINLFKRTYGERIDYKDNDQLIKDDQFDYHIAMGTLPKYLRPSLKSFQLAKNYKLEIDHTFSNKIRKTLIDSRFKKIVGISWKSNSKMNIQKSLKLEEFILGIYSPDIRFVCLQYGDVKEEIQQVRERHGIEICELKEVDKFNDIDHLTALISACDEVISVSNVTVHLAGAIGKQSKILVPSNNLFYLGIKDISTCWYPSLRLFRQSNSGKWTEPLSQIKTEITLSKFA